MNSHKVTVYSTPTCPYCVMTKSYLSSKNVKFEDIDVSQDQAKALEMVKKSGQMGVPVTDINGQVIVGFQPHLFDRLLQEK